MTLDEALAKIAELEQENENLKKRPMRVSPVPCFRDFFGTDYNIQTADFTMLLSAFRYACFGVTPNTGALQTTDGKIIGRYRTKRANQLTEGEYAYYSDFCRHLFALVKEYIDRCPFEREKGC